MADPAPVRLRKLEAALIVIVTTAFFSDAAWLFLNAAITGEPLYFFRSRYSNLAFLGNITDEFRWQLETPIMCWYPKKSERCCKL